MLQRDLLLPQLIHMHTHCKFGCRGEMFVCLTYLTYDIFDLVNVSVTMYLLNETENCMVRVRLDQDKSVHKHLCPFVFTPVPGRISH